MAAVAASVNDSLGRGGRQVPRGAFTDLARLMSQIGNGLSRPVRPAHVDAPGART
jgi:hypothetical protein